MNRFLKLIPILLASNLSAWALTDGTSASNDKSGQELSKEERIENLKQEILRRKALRATSINDSKIASSPSYDPAKNGAVYQPNEKSEKDISGLVLSNMPIGIAADFYAELRGKEVMVSSKVSGLKFNLRLGNTNRSDAIDAFEEELFKLGVTIIELTDEIVVLIDK